MKTLRTHLGQIAGAVLVSLPLWLLFQPTADPSDHTRTAVVAAHEAEALVETIERLKAQFPKESCAGFSVLILPANGVRYEVTVMCHPQPREEFAPPPAQKAP